MNALSKQNSSIEEWFDEKWKETPASFYGSIDLRDAGFKIAPVDTNLFPAGFNNLSLEFMSVYVQAVKKAVKNLYANAQNILLIPENHTRNIFYLENLVVLQKILISAGFNTKIGSLREDLTGIEEHRLSSGILQIFKLERDKDRLKLQDFYPDLVILNNDLSPGIPKILKDINQKIVPPVKLGWFNRLKSEHFKYYEAIIRDFSSKFAIDSWLLGTFFDYCRNISFHEGKNLTCLVSHAEDLFLMIHKKYKDYGIREEPFLVIKADMGTYGMAVHIIKHPQELYHLNRKQKNKMAYTKGGQPVSSAIIQEGVYSINTIHNTHAVAEPVTYLIGNRVIGGFYRGHHTKNSIGNLNTKGMFFSGFTKKETETLLNVACENKNFYAYNVISRLAFLAASHELNSLKEL